MSIRISWRVTALGLGLACCVATAPAAEAQAAFPNKRVTIVVPYSAGGLTDTLARSLAAKLALLWGQPVVVENRDGAGTIIGTSAVARTPADGYTLLFTSYAYTSNPVLRRQLPYGPDAFRPVGLLGSSHNVLLVTNRLRGQSLQNLIDRAKAEPGSFKLASSGPGSSPHLAAELFSTKAGIRFTHVPYKGQGPSMTDLMAGVVDGMFDGMSSYALVKSGKVAAVAIAAEQRHPGAPEIPTFKELGMDFVSGSWFGMLAPAATPDAVVRQINADLHRALEDPAVRAQIAKTGLLVSLSTPEVFGQFLQAETRKLQALLQSGVRIDLD
ncbi:tripartite tricarboxylate transporter substrate binding protein [Comamonas sp. MYb69]|uniref:tripartite tricarboxylate transporter substrate binding protein n=1 Tax=Comamonas sp. MYb69 TaxID=1848650 RepID=UPI0030953806